MNLVVLAHQSAFRIGPVEVRPTTRTLVRDGREQVVEPRVMQVLVVLASARGAVVSRDELVERCWSGRIVGDDAVNRILSRLRQLERGIGRGAFSVETITRVGYRLKMADEAEQVAPWPIHDRPPPAERDRAGVDRRQALLLGAGALVAAGAAGWALIPGGPPRRIAEMMEQAQQALCQCTSEGQSQAIGILQQVVVEAPDYADGWATLGITYGQAAQARARAEADGLFVRARAAGHRARLLDRDNGLALFSLSGAQPQFGHWQIFEQALAAARARRPEHKQLLFSSQWLMLSVGRHREALRFSEELVRRVPFTPGFAHVRIQALWAGGRLEEADALMDQAAKLFPNHYGLWFDRFYIWMVSGRADKSLALAADRSQRPAGIPERDIDSVVRMARAALTRDPALVEAVLAEHVERARRGAGYAENAIQYSVFFGRPDRALALARAYYFDEGLTIPEIAYSPEQAMSVARNNRSTDFLFNPLMRPLHRRPEFADILRRIGLADYWRRSGAAPDYLA